MTETFVIEPVGASFDVDAAMAYLAALPHVARDPVVPCVFMLTASADLLELLLEGRAADAEGYPPSVTLVQVEPHRILVTPGTDGLATAREFVRWLALRGALRFLDHELRDITQRAHDDLDALLAEQ